MPLILSVTFMYKKVQPNCLESVQCGRHWDAIWHCPSGFSGPCSLICTGAVCSRVWRSQGEKAPSHQVQTADALMFVTSSGPQQPVLIPTPWHFVMAIGPCYRCIKYPLACMWDASDFLHCLSIVFISNTQSKWCECPPKSTAKQTRTRPEFESSGSPIVCMTCY